MRELFKAIIALGVFAALIWMGLTGRGELGFALVAVGAGLFLIRI